jgi:hypothetical protein
MTATIVPKPYSVNKATAILAAFLLGAIGLVVFSCSDDSEPGYGENIDIPHGDGYDPDDDAPAQMEQDDTLKVGATNV